jgi:hypothetical protein
MSCPSCGVVYGIETAKDAAKEAEAYRNLPRVELIDWGPMWYIRCAACGAQSAFDYDACKLAKADSFTTPR